MNDETTRCNKAARPLEALVGRLTPEETEMIGPAGAFAAPKTPEKKWEHDIYVQCTRCRNKHMESDRVETALGKHGLRTMACPKCGGHSFYKLDDTGKRCL